jgi:histidine triad (HIT) family protein
MARYHRRMTAPDCLFCRIAAGEVPADVVHDGERLLAFRDINPQAPVHLLVIPKQHVASLADAEDEHGGVLGELLLLARDLAFAEGIAEAGFRTVMNTGRDGGQSVGHLHLHLLGGRSLGWPPG